MLSRQKLLFFKIIADFCNVFESQPEKNIFIPETWHIKLMGILVFGDTLFLQDGTKGVCKSQSSRLWLFSGENTVWDEKILLIFTLFVTKYRAHLVSTDGQWIPWKKPIDFNRNWIRFEVSNLLLDLSINLESLVIGSRVEEWLPNLRF